MDITPASINAFFTVYIAPNFWQAYESTPVWWKEVATLFPSAGNQNVYAWMAKIQRMRQWLGERQIQNVASYPYTLPNLKFENTIAIDRTTFEDDQYGIYAPMISELGWSAAKWPDDILRNTIETGVSTLCFDGQDFFSGSHPIATYTPALGTYSNLFNTAGGNPRPLTLDNYAYVRTQMRKYQGEDGKPLNIIPNVLMVPPALEQEGKRILEAPFLAEGTMGGVTGVGSQTNVYAGTAKLLVNPDLTSDTQWYLMDVSKPIKPFIFQQRIAPELVPRVAPNDPKVFDQDIFTWGLRARGNTGFSLPFLCAQCGP